MHVHFLHIVINQLVEVLNYAQVILGVERMSLWMGIVDAERKMKNMNGDEDDDWVMMGIARLN